MQQLSPRSTTLGAILSVGLLTVAAPVAAEPYSVVDSRDAFVGLVSGRELRRMGINLTVTPDGQIAGRAFGTPVSGAWTWNGGFFCRDLYFGDEDLGYNCQVVEVAGETVRFTSDQGTGDSAALTLR